MARKATTKGIEEGAYRWLGVHLASRNDFTENVTYTLRIPGTYYPVTVSEPTPEKTSGNGTKDSRP